MPTHPPMTERMARMTSGKSMIQRRLVDAVGVGGVFFVRFGEHDGVGAGVRVDGVRRGRGGRRARRSARVPKKVLNQRRNM